MNGKAVGFGMNVEWFKSYELFGRLPRGPPQVHKMRRSVLSVAKRGEACEMEMLRRPIFWAA